ncbi:uncharacterized protein [Macrobrachium rosenbergii]|uniref:uncharacterized protein n=1 Tax=Macrobrachium rosenbergii TaxID=79674 RepID=UPI0034D75D60
MTQIVVPRSLVPTLQDIVHCRSGSQHLGIEKRYQDIWGQFFWKNMLGPKANGISEQANRKVIEALRITVGGNDVNWDRYIPHVQHSISSMVSDTTGMSPAEALLGYPARGTFDLLLIPSGDDTVKSLISIAKERYARLAKNLELKTQDMVDRSNSKPDRGKVVAGDRFFMKINVRNQLNYKLGPKFEGPFQVLKVKKGNRSVVQDENTRVSRLTHI